MQFLDTNILLYSISTNPLDAPKRSRALELLSSDSNALSVQVLQEFYVQSTRASRPDALPGQLAEQLIQSWSRFPVQDMTLPLLESALRLHNRYRLSFWDGCVVAAALVLGCDTLYTEDLNHGQQIEGLTIRNPFL